MTFFEISYDSCGNFMVSGCGIFEELAQLLSDNCDIGSSECGV